MSERVIRDTAVPGPKRISALLLVTGAVLTALALRAAALYIRGALDYDETYYYILGRNLFTGKGYTLNGLPHTAFPPLYPIFVGLTSLFSSNVLFCASLISAIAGALLPVPVYFLAKEMSNRRVAVVAAWTAAVWPALYFFAVRNIPYRLRMYAGSEPLFITLLIAGIALMWLAARRDQLRWAAPAGAVIGLAVLTRNEATVILGFLWLWFAVDRVFFSSLAWRKRAAQAALVAAAFAVVVSPWAVYVHSASGKYSLGSKLSNLVRTRPGLYKWIERGLSRRYVELHYALNADATELEDDYWGVSDWQRSRTDRIGNVDGALRLIRNPDWRWARVLLRIFTTDRLPVVPWYVWPFIVIGAFARPRDRLWTRGWLLYGTMVVVLILQAITIYAIARFQLPMLALLAVPAARGIDAVGRLVAFVTGIATRSLRIEPFAYACAAGAVLLAMAVQGTNDNWRLPRERFVRSAISSNAGDLALSRQLASELPPGASVMCNKPWVPLYAGLDWRASPFGGPEQLLKYATSRKIDFAILGKWQMPSTPIEKMAYYPYLVKVITLFNGEKNFLFDFRPAWQGNDAPRP